MSDSTPIDEDTLAERVAHVADEFAAQLERGEQPSVEEYSFRYPDLASQLKQVLPALRFMRVAHEAAPANGARSRHPALAPGDQLGEYRIVREIGRGGMGVVYEAEQLSLGRRVALKVLPSVAALDAKHLQRFKNEAHAAAQLHHSNIVPVYGLGCEDNLHFYAMQIIEGQSLAELIQGRRELRALESDANKPPSSRTTSAGHLFFRQIAEWGIQAAEGLDHAHQIGILHRDIKPANLLIDHREQLWITDFGLARLAGDSDLTMTGDLLGTIRYMSPEQALSKHALVDQRADIYSLGITLYELLTLEPAFGESDRAALLQQVVQDEPRPPRRLDPGIPTELETIVLKSFAKVREERYATAKEFADDLRCFLDNRPIRARRPTLWQRSRKWSQRHRAIVNTAALTSVAALVALTILATLDRQQIQLKQLETTNALAEATTRGREARQARDDLQRTLVDAYTSTGLIASEHKEAGEAILWFAQAAHSAASMSRGDDPLVEEDVKDVSGIDARTHANRLRFQYWSRMVPIPAMAVELGTAIRTFAFQPGGDCFLALGQEGRCRILDYRFGKTIELGSPSKPVAAAQWSPDGQDFALGFHDGDVKLFSFPSLEVMQSVHLEGPATCLSFNQQGTLLAAGESQIQIWDLSRRRLAAAKLGHPRPVVQLTFNSRGDRLATGCTDGLARVFKLVSGADDLEAVLAFAPMPNLPQMGMAALGMKPQFLDHDKGLILCGREGASYCDAKTGKEVKRLASGEVDQLRSSPDGEYLIVCQGNTARLWSTNPLQPVGAELKHDYRVLADFAPDGQSVLTASSYHIHRWSVPNGIELEPIPLKHQEGIFCLACSSSGQFFATAQTDGLARIWAFPRPAIDISRMPHDGFMSCARLAPDGRHALSAGAGWWPNQLHRTRMFDLASGEGVGPFLDTRGVITDAAISPDGSSAAIVTSTAASPADRFRQHVSEGNAGQLQRWNWQTGRTVGEPILLPSDPRNVAYSPDGKRLVVLCGGGQGLLVDASTGKVLENLVHGHLEDSENRYSDVRFAPDGSLFVTCGLVSDVCLWDTETGEPRLPRLDHGDHCRSARFSADGKYLLTASRDKSARVWDVASGKLAGPELKHPGELFEANFSPDGRLVLTACGDGMARVWDWRSGKLAGPTLKHNDVVCSAIFSPDGSRVFTVDRIGLARLWELATFKPLTPWLRAGAKYWFATNAIFSSDGLHAVAASHSLPIPIFHFPQASGPEFSKENERLLELAELLSGFRLEAGEIAGLTSREWLDRWQKLAPLQTSIAILAQPSLLDWHRSQASEFELTNNFAGAGWHLARLIRLQPSNAGLHVRYGNCLVGQSMVGPAIKEFSRALHLEPGLEAYCGRARAYEKNRAFDRAIADFSEAIRRSPNYARLYLERASAREQKQDFAGTIIDLETVLKLDPSFHANGSVWVHLADAHNRLGNTAKAKVWLNVARSWFEESDRIRKTQLGIADREHFLREFNYVAKLMGEKPAG